LRKSSLRGKPGSPDGSPGSLRLAGRLFTFLHERTEEIGAIVGNPRASGGHHPCGFVSISRLLFSSDYSDIRAGLRGDPS
jgi:hypothetical protein